MRMPFRVAGALLAIPLTVSAQAADLKQGWTIIFQQETFSGATFASGYDAQATTDAFKAGLAYLCGTGGKPTFAFYPAGLGMEQAVDVDFRGASGVKTFHFGMSNLPRIGTSRSLKPADADALKQMITAANGADVPFRQGDASGTFPGIGAEKAFAVIDAECGQ